MGLLGGDWNPFDGDFDPAGDGPDEALGEALGYAAVGGAAGAALGGVTALQGAGAGTLLGGMLGGGQKPPQSGGGGGAPMDAALMNQLQAQLGIANINGNAMRDVANTQADASRAMANAGIQQSRHSAIGAIIGAAMGAHTTQEQIKQWLPHEAGAASIKSYELAQKWNTTLTMKQQGYQDVAINYALNNKDGRALFRDPQWNAMKMAEDLKKDTLTNLQMFGVKSDKNPNGVAMSPEEYIELMSFKPADSILNIDPKVAEQRNKQFEDWEAKMRKDGLGMIVDMYKNPQLAGTSILSMKGPEPVIDPSLAPLIKAISGGDAIGDSIAGAVQQQEQETEQGTYVGTNGKPINNTGKPYVTTGGVSREIGPAEQAEIKKIKAELNKKLGELNTQYGAVQGGQASPAFTAARKALIEEYGAREMALIGNNTQNAQAQASMNQAWEQVMNGQNRPKTEEIKKLQEMGVIDKYGMVNGGVLMSFVPPELTAAPEFSVTREIGEKEKAAYMDEFNKYMNMNIDPKNIVSENLGQGVTRKTLKNADGTIAGSMMEGYMTNAMGESVFVSMAGTRLQNWYDKMSMINGLGPLFPGVMAPVTDSELNGSFEPGFWDKQPGAPTYKPMTAQGQNSKPQADSRMSAPGTELPKAPTPTKQTTTTAPKKSSVPSGYSGAPLAAGG